MGKIDCGIYRHYKNKEYTVYSVSLDEQGNEYVLYKQNYDDETFWIRPIDDFFNNIDIFDSERKETVHCRFELVEKEKRPHDCLDNLIMLMKSREIFVKHAKSEDSYVIINISTDEEKVIVQWLQKACGYLTDYDIIKRMNKNCCIINNKFEIWDINHKKIDPYKQLVIDNYDNSKILECINPCSIDLEIAESDFWKTKNKVIDLESIAHTFEPDKWWKKVKCKISSNTSNVYFKLKPGNTIVTHLKNKIKIPKDCAGKIEIKSSYARLSLSITSSDFCNPGYEGYFPLEITNHGKSTIIIYGNQVMAQLILIPLTSPIVTSYISKATQKNNENIDEGVPYYFWKEYFLKKIRSNTGGEIAIEFYDEFKKNISKDKVNDINAYKQRFEKKFFSFYEKKLRNEKIDNNNDIIRRLRKTIDEFIREEKIKKVTYEFIKKISIIDLIILFTNVICLFLEYNNSDFVKKLPLYREGLFICFVKISLIVLILLIIAILTIRLLCGSDYCTLEKFDIDKIFNEMQNKRK